MNPLSRSVANSFCTPRLWRSSVVRMKSSYVSPSRSHKPAKLAGDLCRRTPAACIRPALATALNLLPVLVRASQKPCSMPSARLRRAMASHTIVE